MKAAYIDYSQTNSFSKTLISYLEADEKLDAFISKRPNLDGFAGLIAGKKTIAHRDILVEKLQEQYRRIAETGSENYQLVINNIKILSDPDTYTITTGHQLNIFTGPLYFLYKIVTAINLAKELKAEFPDKNFVPVYWMATEDHDFAEINHTRIHGQKLQWNNEAKGATGRMDTSSMQDVVREYLGILGLSENTKRLSFIIEQAYLQQRTLADATRYLVNALFGKYGLVIVDADERELKTLFVPVIKQDIFEQNSFREITDSTGKLHDAGFESQVNAREINFFYMKDGFRERIVFENNRYYVLNSSLSFAKEELETEIDNHPERFSPNVMLRPLYQEIILPNLAYIGGGAEIVYWLQLKQNFDYYKVDFPILVLRNSAMLADKGFEDKLQRLDIRFTDLFQESDALKKNWVQQHSQHDLSLADEWQELKCIFEKIKLRAYKIDPTLAPSTEAVRERLHHQLKNLEKKFIKAEKRNYATALSQIDTYKSKLFPGNGLQERSENFGSFYVKYGDELIDQLVKHFRPLDFKFTILY